MRLRRWIAIAFAAPWVAWALGRTLGLDLRHPLVAIVAFTPYAALTSPLPVLVALALRRWLVALLALAAAGALIAAVLPRELAGDPPRAGRTLTVMTANVYAGRGEPGRLMELVRRHRVDVLALQEVQPQTLSGLDAAGVAEVLPGRAVDPVTNNAVLARWAVRPAPDTSTAMEAHVEVPGLAPVWVASAHPRPPITRTAERDWRRQLGLLPGTGTDGALRIVAGDLNATLDHRVLRALLDRGYVDAADARGDGLEPTWPVGPRRRAFPITIDHVLADRRMGVRSYRVHDVPGSDHRAVVAVLTVPER